MKILLSVFLSLCLLLSLAFCEAQSLESYFGPAIDSIGNLPEITEFTVDAERNLFLVNNENGMLYKYFALADYDSMISIGGRGNREEGFLSPSHLSVQNRQTIYLLDEASQKIVVLSPSFRLLKSVDFLSLSGLDNQSESLYPISFDVSGIGELFILNQWDNKVYKRNEQGQTERSFGGLDYGEGSLYDPEKIRVNEQGQVFVSEQKHQRLKVFDIYGRFRFTLKPQSSFHWSDFTVQGDLLFCWGENHLYWQRLSTSQSGELMIPGLRSLALDREILYLLIENTVHLYRFNDK